MGGRKKKRQLSDYFHSKNSCYILMVNEEYLGGKNGKVHTD